MYGLAARAVRISADRLTYRYLLRPEARFHDGTKLTAHDVAFSLKLLKEKGHPIIGQMMRDFLGAEAEDDATVVLKFRAQARARRAAVRRRPADLLARAIIRRENFEETTLDAAARLGSLQGRAFRSRTLHRIRPRQGLVGRGAADRARTVQFRRRALRVLSRPRRRVRGLHRQELPVPRGVHRAHLGDALRFSRHQGWPRQAGDPARRHALRRAGLVHEHAARQVQEHRRCAKR